MSNIAIAGDTSGTVTLQAPAVAGTTVLTLPSTSGTIVTTAGGTSGSFTTLTSTQDATFATSSGNVGIGTASPGYKLEVRSSSDTEIGIVKTSVGTVKLGSYTGTESRLTSDPGYITLYTGSPSSEKLRIDTSGAIGLSGANYGTSGQVLTSNGSGAAASWTTISTSPPTTLYAIGTYIVGRPSNLNDYVPNDTIAGSSLNGVTTPAYYTGTSFYIYNAQQGGARSTSTNNVGTGTWRCMSRAWGNSSDTAGSGLWVRIS